MEQQLFFCPTCWFAKKHNPGHYLLGYISLRNRTTKRIMDLLYVESLQPSLSDDSVKPTRKQQLTSPAFQRAFIIRRILSAYYIDARSLEVPAKESSA